MRSLGSMVVFFLILTTLIGGVHYYLYARLVKATALEAWQRPGAILLTASALFIPLGMFASRLLPRSVGNVLALLVFSWMGLFVITFFTTLGAELLRGGAAILRLANVLPDDPERRTFLARILSGGVGALSLVVTGWGAVNVRGPVQIKPVSIALRKFPAVLDGLKIVQITDVHVGPTIDGTFLRRVVEQVNALDPDIVAITGDLVDGSVAELAEHVAPLGDLKAKHGVFFVTGNHEYYSGVDDWLAELARLGVRALRNERVEIGTGEDSFYLAGVDDWRAKGFGNGHGADLAKALEGRDPAREVVLLAHQPKQALEAAEHGVGLQLSGHTHGGQIFPWGLMVKLDQHFVAGLDRLKDLQVYTSCGTGYWGPPMRVGAPAEITLIELRRG